MLVTGLHIEGLRGGDGLELDELGGLRMLPRGPAGIAALDALDLVAATCDPDRTAGTLARLGVVGSADDAEVLVEDKLPVQARCEGADAAAMVDPAAGRAVRVRVDLELDPPLFGRLREQALRDPRLVSALGDASLSLRIGWIWTRDLTTVSIGLLGVAVGDVAFPATGADRPAWLPELLREVAARIRRVEPTSASDVAGRLHDAALSTDPEARRRQGRVADALAEAPFALGTLNLTRIRGRIVPCFGPDLLRPRQLGPAATEALRLCTAVYLDEPDVLLVEGGGQCQADPDAVVTWLRDRTHGDKAVLEQVLIAPGGPA